MRDERKNKRRKKMKNLLRLCVYTFDTRLLDTVRQLCTRFELSYLAGSDFDSFFGTRVDTCASSFLDSRECTET